MRVERADGAGDGAAVEAEARVVVREGDGAGRHGGGWRVQGNPGDARARQAERRWRGWAWQILFLSRQFLAERFQQRASCGSIAPERPGRRAVRALVSGDFQGQGGAKGAA